MAYKTQNMIKLSEHPSSDVVININDISKEDLCQQNAGKTLANLKTMFRYLWSKYIQICSQLYQAQITQLNSFFYDH